jgi:hypothetical protein
MFNEAGQIDHLTFAGVRGGGKGGSSDSAMESYLLSQMNNNSTSTSYTDPSTGMQYSSQDALNAAIAQNKLTAANSAAVTTQQATDTATQNENTFQSNRQQAYSDALNSVMNTFQGQGVNPANYMGYITPQLQSAYNSIPDLSSNVSSYFPSSLGQTILNSALGDQRTQATNAINQTFTPTYAQNMLPSSMMSQPISDMLSSQFDPLSAQLTNALNRGTLNQAGYNAALAKMNQDKATAQSQLNTLGQNILTGYQTGLTGIGDTARTAAANTSLGQSFDPSQYASQAGTQASQDIQGFSGALQNAASNVQYGDITDLLNAGGVVQGANNPTAANPTAGTGAIGTGGSPTAGQITQAGQDQANRGLGNTGAF